MSERRPLPTTMEMALAGLLHDIGKLEQRAAGGKSMPRDVYERAGAVLPSYQGRYSHWHALWSDVFFDRVETEGLRWPEGVDGRWVRDLAVHHHNPLDGTRALPGLSATHLVTVADRVAAGMERKPRDEDEEADTSKHAFRRTPLDALLPRLSLTVDGEALGTGRRSIYLPSEISAQSVRPLTFGDVDGAAVERAYGTLGERFMDAWRELCGRTRGDARAFEEGALSVSERFAWAVPSSTIDQPDVSLHDHSRVVGAVAAALWAYHAARGETATGAFRDGEQPRLRFLVGDLSGLQATLFRLASEQVKGLNRILRGRSQRFALIADAAVRRVLDALELPAACALQTAGGRFQILIPALEDDVFVRRIDDLRAEFDDWLASEYYGELGLGLAVSRPFGTAELTNGSRARKVFEDLSVAVETAKLRQLEGPLSEAIFDVAYLAGPCSACGVRPARPGNGVVSRCRACETEHSLGRRWPKARAVVVAPTGRLPEEDADEIFSLSYYPAVSEGSERHDWGLGWRFPGVEHGPAPIRFGGAYVPAFGEDLERYQQLEDFDEIESGDVKTLAALALDGQELDDDGRAIGRQMLAVLKADVDRLGALFAEGLGDDQGLSRRAALSRMLDAYFAGRLRLLLEAEFPNAYTVYAGGDDVMIVAPWRDALALALALRRDFGAFTGENGSVTLSAGLALFDPRTPISIAAAEAEDRLEAAKAAGRDRVSAMSSRPMTWDEYAAALEAAERLNGELRCGRLSTAAVYRLLSFDVSRRRVAAGEASAHDLGWKARLGYQLARMFPDRGHEGPDRDLVTFLFALLGLTERGTASTDGAGRTLDARLAISHALYRNR